MNENPLVSVIINCHNGEKFLKIVLKVFLINHIEILKLFFGTIGQQIIVIK